METRKIFVCLGFVVSLIVTCISQSTWAVGPRLAYSKNLGVEIFAELEEDQWCQSVVSIQVKSENPSFYNSEQFSELFAKVGRVIEQECKEAAIANIVGISNEDQTKPDYLGFAERAENWTVTQTNRSSQSQFPHESESQQPVNNEDSSTSEINIVTLSQCDNLVGHKQNEIVTCLLKTIDPVEGQVSFLSSISRIQIDDLGAIADSIDSLEILADLILKNKNKYSKKSDLITINQAAERLAMLGKGEYAKLLFKMEFDVASSLTKPVSRKLAMARPLVDASKAGLENWAIETAQRVGDESARNYLFAEIVEALARTYPSRAKLAFNTIVSKHPSSFDRIDLGLYKGLLAEQYAENWEYDKAFGVARNNKSILDGIIKVWTREGGRLENLPASVQKIIFDQSGELEKIFIRDDVIKGLIERGAFKEAKEMALTLDSGIKLRHLISIAEYEIEVLGSTTLLDDIQSELSIYKGNEGYKDKVDEFRERLIALKVITNDISGALSLLNKSDIEDLSRDEKRKLYGYLIDAKNLDGAKKFLTYFSKARDRDYARIDIIYVLMDMADYEGAEEIIRELETDDYLIRTYEAKINRFPRDGKYNETFSEVENVRRMITSGGLDLATQINGFGTFFWLSAHPESIRQIRYNDCDKYAASNLDLATFHPGIPADYINLQAAVEACSKIINKFPFIPLYQYQYGRSLVLAGRPREGLIWLKRAANLRSIPTPENSAARQALSVIYLNGLSVNKNDFLAAKYASSAAHSGHIAAQYNLAWLYLNGRGVKQDNFLAFKWANLSARRGYSDAQHLLGSIYRDGLGITKSSEKALTWFRLAAKHGNVEALKEVINLCGGKICDKAEDGKIAYLSETDFTWTYHDGLPVSENLWPLDHVKWEKILKNSSTANKENQTTSKANPAEQGQFEKAQAAYDAKDYSTAYSLFLPLAETGNASAQFKLGWMFDQGLGVSKNEEKAAHWYKESATNGNRDAQFNYGTMLYHGRGVKEDKAQSVAWKEKAAEQGVLDAQIEVGLAYMEGEGVKSDETKGCYWAKKAAELDVENMQVQTMLGICYVEGRYVSKDVNRGLQLLESARDKGSEIATMLLAFAYADGTYIIADQDKARRLLEDAAATGNPILKRELEEFNLKNASNHKADKYFIKPEKPSGNLFWKTWPWTEDSVPGMSIGLHSSNNSKDMMGIDCFKSNDGKNIFTLKFEYLPYQLQSPYKSHLMNGELRFKDGAKFVVQTHVHFSDPSIYIYLSESEAREFTDALDKNDGNLGLYWKSYVSLKKEFHEKNKLQPKIFSALKSQGPLVVDAPSKTHGPLKELIGVYRQACLGEENGKSKLKVISGWTYDAGDIAPNWQTPSLSYEAGTLQIDCMMLGDKKGGYVDFRLAPYKYMSGSKKTMIFEYPNGKQYSLNAEVDRDSWSLKSKLDVDSLRTLVSESVVNGGRFKVKWDNSYYAVDRANGLSYLNDFLAACH